MEKLVNKRFGSIDEIIDYLQKVGYKEVNVFESESNLLDGLDFQLDGCVDDKDFTLCYLKDRSNKYYITESWVW